MTTLAGYSQANGNKPYTLLVISLANTVYNRQSALALNTVITLYEYTNGQRLTLKQTQAALYKTGFVYRLAA